MKKPVHFVHVSFVFALLLLVGTLAAGQENVAPQLKGPVAPRNGRGSVFSSFPQGSHAVAAFAPSRKQETPQTAGLSFASPVTYDTGGIETEAVAAEDLNGDGYPDLVIANACGSNSTCTAGSVTVLLNNGNGTFGKAVAYGSGGVQPLAVAVADVNGDGKPDIVVANSCVSVTGTAGCTTDGSVAVLLGNGDGTFQTAVSYDSGGFFARWVVIADINLDGKPDLIVVNRCGTSSVCSGDSTVAVLLGNGDGTFQTAVNYDTGGTGSEAVAVADVGGNDNPDLIVANQCLGACNGFPGPQSTVGVLLGNGDGTFQSVVNYVTNAWAISNIAVADVNGDGKLDLAVSSPCEAEYAECDQGGGGVAVLLGNGDGTLQAPSQFSIGNYEGGLVAIQDVNGDGKPDLVVSAECGMGPPSCAPLLIVSVEVLLGNGDGTFQTARDFAHSATRSRLSPASR